ncbi:TenA family protein [Wolbachia endosymbiont of Mansonella perstans]|uniref:TenA family protein n=1 Tax=Wolbachia endosymbiont of Mansonella perstans TaxID=229526 RepID=UPI001CE1DC97|nr:TenA family protein [Wolbachia endosymbiont of Mansonella perstans]MCA4774188.1 TenA family protein [Wolbachia endosymbiont of Mansonella perstans]
MCNRIEEKFYDIAVRESSDLIEKIKEHPFNVELMDSTLDYEKFKFYLQQDFLYLVDCTRALLVIAAKVNEVEIMNSLINVARGTFDVRKQYKKYFEDCDLSDNHKKSRTCSAFTDFFMCAAYHNSVAEALAASYPCFNIYQIVVHHMMNKITPRKVKNNKYEGWIDIYNSKTMDAAIYEVTNIINKLYKKAGEYEKKRMREFFKRGLELELMFWDEVYYFNTPMVKAC